MTQLYPCTILFYGCHREIGHYLYDHRGIRIYDNPDCPWDRYSIDGKLAPQVRPVPRDRFATHHKDGWTAISWWDNTIDARPGSNSTVLIDRTLEPQEALDVARAQLPWLTPRLTNLQPHDH